MVTAKKYKIDDGVSAAYDPRLYQYEKVAEKVQGLGVIGESEKVRYHEQGYLAVEGALSMKEVEDAREALNDLVSGKRADFDGIMYEAGIREEELEAMGLEEKLDKVRKFMFYVEYDARLKAIAEKAELLEVVGRLMGGAEPRLFQDMALIKPPKMGREKPWHQDHAYFDLPVGTPVVGVWIALDEATPANGCMYVLPQHSEPIVHFKRRDWQICDTEMMGKMATAVPLKPGGLLLFTSLIPHGTPTNHSGERRRALQYHYAPADTQKIAEEKRLEVFGSEGKDVTC